MRVIKKKQKAHPHEKLNEPSKIGLILVRVCCSSMSGNVRHIFLVSNTESQNAFFHEERETTGMRCVDVAKLI